VALARETFFCEQLKDVRVSDIVVLDESFATTTFTRLRGRCRRDKRLYAPVPHGHWKRLTILAAITTAGLLTAGVIDASTNADVFRSFIAEALVPGLRSGMVVIMDNLSSHKVSGIRELIENAGCRLIYLPPYSPDFSPIENIFSKVKQLLRSAGARDVPGLMQAIHDALSQITADDCVNCFSACGYTLRKE
jgi:transposase